MNATFKYSYLRVLLPLIFLTKLSSAQISMDSTATDSSLQIHAGQEPAGTGRSGLSFNPDLGVIGDFQGSYISEGDRKFDAYLNETEVSLKAVVDPYVRADFYLSFGRDPVTHEYGVEVEEGYLTTLSLPARLQLKVGKFRQALGRINTLHPHALPFIDMPNAFVNYFGDEGLNDEGGSLSWLIPNSAFYQDIVFQVTSGYSESPSFERSDKSRFVYLGHLKNFWDLSENTTLELGLTGISGENDSSATTNIAAADLTFKWKPVQLNAYRSLTWQSEFYFSNRRLPEQSHVNSFGLYSFLQYQIAKRWFLTGRFDYSEMPNDNSIHETAFSLTAGWYATEFQKIELEGKTTDPSAGDRFYEAWLRWIFVIGAHGAHQY